jgi:hypothetical protein
MGPATVSSRLLSAWADGLCRNEIDRAPWLLGHLGLLGEDEDWAAMTVGECDRKLLEVRASLFGDLVAVCACPGCGEQVEVTLSAPQFAPPGESHRPVVVEDGRFRVEARLPLNRDLSELADMARAPLAADLLALCVLRADSAGRQVGVSQIPEDIGQRILATLALHDSGADLPVALDCPQCSASWQEVLDIRDFFWAELTSWAYGLLEEIRALAAAYGWSESEILAMSDKRRLFYLEAVQL